MISLTFLTSRKLLQIGTRIQTQKILALRTDPSQYRTGFKGGSGCFSPTLAPFGRLLQVKMFEQEELGERLPQSLYYNALEQHQLFLDCHQSSNQNYFDLSSAERTRESCRRVYRELAGRQLKHLSATKPGSTARNFGQKKFIGQLNQEEQVPLSGILLQLEEGIYELGANRSMDLLRRLCELVKLLSDKKYKVYWLEKIEEAFRNGKGQGILNSRLAIMWLCSHEDSLLAKWYN